MMSDNEDYSGAETDESAKPAKFSGHRFFPLSNFELIKIYDFHVKVIEEMRQVLICVQNRATTKATHPLDDEERKKLAKKSVEFSRRYSRYYIYPLQSETRQVLIALKSQKLREKEGRVHLRKKMTAAYQLAVQALQNFAAYTSQTKNLKVYDKLKELLEALKSLHNACKNILQPIEESVGEGGLAMLTQLSSEIEQEILKPEEPPRVEVLPNRTKKKKKQRDVNLIRPLSMYEPKLGSWMMKSQDLERLKFARKVALQKKRSEITINPVEKPQKDLRGTKSEGSVCMRPVVVEKAKPTRRIDFVPTEEDVETQVQRHQPTKDDILDTKKLRRVTLRSPPAASRSEACSVSCSHAPEKPSASSDEAIPGKEPNVCLERDEGLRTAILEILSDFLLGDQSEATRKLLDITRSKKSTSNHLANNAVEEKRDNCGYFQVVSETIERLDIPDTTESESTNSRRSEISSPENPATNPRRRDVEGKSASPQAILEDLQVAMPKEVFSDGRYRRMMERNLKKEQKSQRSVKGKSSEVAGSCENGSHRSHASSGRLSRSQKRDANISEERVPQTKGLPKKSGTHHRDKVLQTREGIGSGDEFSDRSEKGKSENHPESSRKVRSKDVRKAPSQLGEFEEEVVSSHRSRSSGILDKPKALSGRKPKPVFRLPEDIVEEWERIKDTNQKTCSRYGRNKPWNVVDSLTEHVLDEDTEEMIKDIYHTYEGRIEELMEAELMVK